MYFPSLMAVFWMSFVSANMDFALQRGNISSVRSELNSPDCWPPLLYLSINIRLAERGFLGCCEDRPFHETEQAVSQSK